MKADCYEYVRNYYCVPAYVGVRVRVKDRAGVLVHKPSAGQYVWVHFDGDKRPMGPYHPTDVTYMPAERRSVVGLNESGHAHFADADFIAHAPTDIAYLLDLLDAQARQQTRLREALKAARDALVSLTAQCGVVPNQGISTTMTEAEQQAWRAVKSLDTIIADAALAASSEPSATGEPEHEDGCPAIADDESDYEYLADAGECVCRVREWRKQHARDATREQP